MITLYGIKAWDAAQNHAFPFNIIHLRAISLEK